MAIKGLSKLVLASYSATGNTVTYGSPVVQEKMASYSYTVERASSDGLYLDNYEAEKDGGEFGSGTLTLGTGDLSNATSKAILDVKENSVTVGTSTVTELVYDDDTKGKELGAGIIELHQVDNQDFYRAVWFYRVQFDIPAGSANTKGASINWQAPEITASIMRSDAYDASTGKHPWKSTADFTSEDDALAYLQSKAS